MIQTPRLALRPLTYSDTPFLIELLNSPGWLQFIGDRNARTDEQVRQYLDNGPLKSYREHGFGLMLVEQQENGLPVGMCGLLKRDALDRPDIGFAFLPAFSGRGYAYESARAVLQHANEQLGIPSVAAIVMPDNPRSINLLEKLGMRLIRPIRMSEEGETLLLYQQV